MVKQTEKIIRKIGKETDGLTKVRHTGGQVCRQIVRHTDIGRQTNRQTYRLSDRQTNGQTLR